MKRRIGNALTVLGLLAGLIGFGGLFLPALNKAPQRQERSNVVISAEADSKGWQVAERFVLGMGIGAVFFLLGGHLCDPQQCKESTRLRDPKSSSPDKGRRAMLSVSIVALAVLWALILYLLVLALIALLRPPGETGGLDFKYAVVLILIAVSILVIIPIQTVRYVRERRTLR